MSRNVYTTTKMRLRKSLPEDYLGRKHITAEFTGALKFSVYAGCGKWRRVIGIASEKDGVNVESDRISLTGDLPMISITISRVSSADFANPVKGKLRGPKSAFWMRIE
jgi:hypothetical protein